MIEISFGDLQKNVQIINCLSIVIFAFEFWEIAIVTIFTHLTTLQGRSFRYSSGHQMVL